MNRNIVVLTVDDALQVVLSDSDATAVDPDVVLDHVVGDLEAFTVSVDQDAAGNLTIHDGETVDAGGIR